MSTIEIFLVGIGLSMDAFAVSVCKGLEKKEHDFRYIFMISFLFGIFQAVMPVIGWILGIRFAKYIMSFDHWIAFFLLVIIGANMIQESFSGECPKSEAQKKKNNSVLFRELILLAVATSIDALAVGITFAFLNISIGRAAVIIGITTFFLSYAGVSAGNHFGIKYKNKATLAGGLVLILIGCKILLEHLDFLP